MGTTTIETLQVQLKADVEDLKKQMDAARKSLGQLELGSKETRKELEKLSKAGREMHDSFGGLRSLFAGIGTAYIGKKLLGVGKSAVQAAMDVVESESLFETSMGNMAEAAREWSEQLSESLGLNAYELRKQVGIFYNMSNAMRIASDTSYTLSTNVVQLANDWASFYNMTTAEAYTLAKTIFTGETEPGKRIGMILDEATAKQAAYKHGVAKVGEELTRQQQVLGRYYAAIDQTSTAQGDLARTLDSPANQWRIVNAQIEQARIELGMGLLPLAKEFMPYLVAFAQKLKEIAVGIFGVRIASENLSNSLGGTDYSSITQAAKAETKLGDAIEDTDKKLKKSLTGFDEINKLSTGTETLANQMGLTGDDLSFNIPTLENNLELKSLWDDKKMQKAKEDIDGICEAIGNLRGVLIGLVGYKVIKGLAGLKSGISGLNGSTGKLAKGMIGAGGLIVGFDSIRTAGKEFAKMLDGGDGSMKTAITSLVTGGAGAIIGGLAIGGPIGALAGGMAALGGSIAGMAEAYWDSGIESVYSEMGVSTEELAALTGELGNTIREQVEPLEHYRNNVESLQTQFGKLADAFDSSMQLVGKNTELVGIDVNSVLSNLEQMVDTADTKLRLTTDTAISEYRKLFLINDGMISEEEAKVLTAMEQNYTNQKARLGEIQSKITEIFETASKERRDLTEKEIQDIQQLMDEMAKLAGFQANIGQLKQEAIINDLKSGKLRLSKDQFESFISDQSKNIDELMDQARENYATQVALAQATTGYGTKEFKEDEYNLAVQVAQENYEKQIADLSSQLDQIIDAVGTQFRDAAGDYNKYNHENGAVNVLDTVGAALGGFFAPWAKDSNEDTGWEHIKNKGATKEAKEALDELEALRNKYQIYAQPHGGVAGKFATGGFPGEDGLFYANHEELIGKFINGKTAVANNYQITEGIKQAVLEALQTAGGMDGGNWTIQVVDTDGNIKAEQIISAAERRNRRDGRTILPLGD